MPTCVIDTSAVFADLGEEGAIEARRWLRDAAISALNLQEIVAKAVDEGVPEDAVPDLLERLRLVVHRNCRLMRARPRCRSAVY